MKKFLLAALYALGVTRFAAWWHRKRVVILNYHGITECFDGKPNDIHDLHVLRESFIAQLDYLQRRYRIISLSEYLKARQQGRALPHYSVILTFDDGYRNFLTQAAPLLAERSIPATVFLITEMMHADEHPATDNEHAPGNNSVWLSWAEAQSLERIPGIEFGSHTQTHPSLCDHEFEAVERELRESLASIRHHLKNVIPALAYPNGSYTPSVIAQARAAGYECGLTIFPGANELDDDAYTLRRQTIRGHDTLAIFAARVACLTSWLVSGRNRIYKATRSLDQARVKSPVVPSGRKKTQQAAARPAAID